MSYKMLRCIVKESDKIRTLLNEKFDKLDIFGRQIVKEARSEGKSFSEHSLSRFRNHGNVKGGLSTDDIIYLCDKYGVQLKLSVKKSKGTYIR